MAKTTLYCRARLDDYNKLHVEVTKTPTFNQTKGSGYSPTIFFGIEIEIPDELLAYQVPVAKVVINPADVHLFAGQARIGRLAVADEQDGVQAPESDGEATPSEALSPEAQDG